MEINEIKYGFKLLSKERIDDVNSTLYQYEHLKSGGKVAYIQNEDKNCCFAICFRTVPEDSTGVCHIIEHSVLCGSKKFPLKEPFVNLLKTSLNTFLNAFTAYDWTAYPFASQTPKDFDNILDIYLDAVFNPLSMVDNKPFLQEGWHVELLNEDDTPSYKGVVYNEMKGAMSSVDEVLVQATNEAMYKDTNYRHNSGGEPDDIPSLSYEAYKDFYHRHYTPQNALTYFYGNLDIEKKLEFLDKEYFSKYQRQEKEIYIPTQAPLVNLNYEKEYEIGSEEDTKDNTYISLCFALEKYENKEVNLALNILADALLSKNDSPVKKALLDAKLGQNITYSIDDDNVVSALHIALQKTNKEQKEKFRSLFLDEIRKQVNNGIDKELLLATINHYEFKDKEFDMGRFPKGLILAMPMFGNFVYRNDLKIHLEFSKYYEKLRQELNTGYFEKLLDKYILNSNHNVEVVLVPSKTLGARKKEEMDKKMEELKASLSPEQKKALVKQTKELIEYQNHEDSKKELATLPKLKLKDIPNDINYLDSYKLKVNGMNGIYHVLDTNKIAYLRMFFDVSSLPIEDLPYLSLLRNLYLNVKTSKHDVTSLNKLINIYLGDLSMGQAITSKTKDDASYYFKVSVSSLVENVSYIPEILNEVLLHSKFTKKEMMTMLLQVKENLRQAIINGGMGIAMSTVAANYDKESYLYLHSMVGPKMYDFYKDLIDNFDYNKINNKLKEIVSKIFTKKNVLLTLSGDKDTISALKDALKNLKLPRKEYEKKLEVKINKEPNGALVIPSGISYNALGNYVDYNIPYGQMIVLSQIVNFDYLWKEIRVKGGAYGCNLSINRKNGITFGTYRDPNVKNSYDTFKNIVDYLANFKVSSDEFTSYIIGATAGFDFPMSNSAMINTWDVNYLNGFSKKDKIQTKKEVLKTKQQDIINLASVFKKAMENPSLYTIGNEAKINEFNFDKIDKLS